MISRSTQSPTRPPSAAVASVPNAACLGRCTSRGRANHDGTCVLLCRRRSCGEGAWGAQARCGRCRSVVGISQEAKETKETKGRGKEGRRESLETMGTAALIARLISLLWATGAIQFLVQHVCTVVVGHAGSSRSRRARRHWPSFFFSPRRPQMCLLRAVHTAFTQP